MFHEYINILQTEKIPENIVLHKKTISLFSLHSIRRVNKNINMINFKLVLRNITGK